MKTKAKATKTTKVTKTIFTLLLALGLVLIVNTNFLEDWMVNETYFLNSVEIESEEALKVEDWMLDEKNFQ